MCGVAGAWRRDRDLEGAAVQPSHELWSGRSLSGFLQERTGADGSNRDGTMLLNNKSLVREAEIKEHVQRYLRTRKAESRGANKNVSVTDSASYERKGI